MRAILVVSMFLFLLEAGVEGDTADRIFQLLLEYAGPTFSEFARAAASDLDSADISGQYTLFAPTNTAFEAKMACFNSPKIDQKYKQDVIRYHFINESLTKEAIVAMVGNREGFTWMPFTFYNHQQLNVTLKNSSTVTINDISNVVIPNAMMNGQATVHGIDNVLIPPALQALTTRCLTSASPGSLVQGLGTLLFLLISFITVVSQ